MNWKQTAAAAIVPTLPPVTDPLSLADADTAFALEQALALETISGCDIAFAQSLLAGFAKYRSFTERQRPYARKLAEAPQKPVVESRPVPATLTPPATLCPNLSGLVNLNGFARFTVGDLKLTLKNDGSVIWVKWKDRIAGRIEAGRYIETRRYLSPVSLDLARAALIALEADPLAAAKANGILTGRCSCCGRPLTNPVSIEIGLGPICLGKFGGL